MEKRTKLITIAITLLLITSAMLYVFTISNDKVFNNNIHSTLYSITNLDGTVELNNDTSPFSIYQNEIVISRNSTSITHGFLSFSTYLPYIVSINSAELVINVSGTNGTEILIYSCDYGTDLDTLAFNSGTNYGKLVGSFTLNYSLYQWYHFKTDNLINTDGLTQFEFVLANDSRANTDWRAVNIIVNNTDLTQNSNLQVNYTQPISTISDVATSGCITAKYDQTNYTVQNNVCLVGKNADSYLRSFMSFDLNNPPYGTLIKSSVLALKIVGGHPGMAIKVYTNTWGDHLSVNSNTIDAPTGQYVGTIVINSTAPNWYYLNVSKFMNLGTPTQFMFTCNNDLNPQGTEAVAKIYTNNNLTGDDIARINYDFAVANIVT